MEEVKLGVSGKKRENVLGLPLNEHRCELCGWNKYPIALTLHHIFPKECFAIQPNFHRRLRYLIVCPTCHHVIHLNIFTDKLLKLVKFVLDTCIEEYDKSEKTDEIIARCRSLYGIKEEPKGL